MRLVIYSLQMSYMYTYLSEDENSDSVVGSLSGQDSHLFNKHIAKLHSVTKSSEHIELQLRNDSFTLSLTQNS